ncbi:monofunctional biosynthetic peptidoglycan transglycosylase [Nitrospirillum sp. BR 11752]|uniref:monofunctional biosynthetic peptidoglycan transglycosylase n=1 Tax=Nitrospirillum sp. BR 11752 TaxID=3104293 RepID=UPI002EAC7AC1|nr:monofunctional biosynthetic peptidoglycan transglycosylase [Nitrospirillum sp. BR 11752]
MKAGVGHQRDRRPSLRRALRWAQAGLLAAVVLSLGWVCLYAVVDPPGTPLMLIRRMQGVPTQGWTPVPLDRIAPALQRAVIGAEDSRFCSHHGVDWEAVDAAMDEDEEGHKLRGASTISQQTAKNAFLWPGRTWLRKGVEFGFTELIELVWGKRRILEMYLNIVEWGDGLYGAEAASRAYFGVPAAALSPSQAAALAAVLPSPRKWNARHPGPYVARRIGILEQRAALVARDGLDACLRR